MQSKTATTITTDYLTLADRLGTEQHENLLDNSDLLRITGNT
jgi:hypothetical protein